jgi:hypothetical protein
MASMPSFLLHHHHNAGECRHAFAAWKGFESPLRHLPTMGTCAEGGHSLWWTVEAADAGAALAMLPPYVAERADVQRVAPVPIP